MQQAVARFGSTLKEIPLPDPGHEVLPGVPWGRFEHALTPAFWVVQAWMMEPDINREGFRLGQSLVEEVAACILGGYGIPAEMGLAAYARVRPSLDELAGLSPEDARPRIEAMLATPLMISGKPKRYRFATQKSGHLAGALGAARRIDEAKLGDIALRDELRRLPGIGPKTASWIVRNRRGSDAVAILDIHVVRAGKIMGIFEQTADVNRSYLAMERRFLDFCTATPVRASVLDAAIWQTMRTLGRDFVSYLVGDASSRRA